MITKVETVPHIRLDEQERPWIDDTNIKVIEVALDHLAYGWNAEIIQENHPHLSLAQVYAALAWYYDHQTQMDAEIDQQYERIRALRATITPSSLQQRLELLETMEIIADPSAMKSIRDAEAGRGKVYDLKDLRDRPYN